MPCILIMLDGLRPDAMQQANTPVLDRFRASGSSTLRAQSVMPSITLPCHMSIFHSVPPSRHGIVENDYHPMARPVIGLTEHLKAHDKKAGFIHNWEFLRDVNRPGSLYFNFFIDTGYQLDGDNIIVETTRSIIPAYQLDFTFVYFASIDVAGHMFGWMTDDYIKQVETVDTLVGQVLDCIDMTETTVIIHSDHGGHERTHGTDKPEDMTIPWMIAGPKIKQNYAILRPVSLLDTAPTIAALLGLAPQRDWEGTAVDEAFAL